MLEVEGSVVERHRAGCGMCLWAEKLSWTVGSKPHRADRLGMARVAIQRSGNASPLSEPAPPFIRRAPGEGALQNGAEGVDALFPVGRVSGS